MKKRTLLFLAFFATAMGIRAQDTLTMANPKPSYYAPYWTTTDSIGGISSVGLSNDYYATTRSFYTEDTLTIYGIAVSAQLFSSEPAERLENTYEYLRVYKRSGDSMTVISDSMLMLHMRDTPVTYYLNIDKIYQPVDFLPPFDIPTFPVYELYYEHPLTVTDSFHVGMTNLHYHIDSNGYMMALPIVLKGVMPKPYDPKVQKQYAGLGNNDGSWDFTSESSHIFMYPILAPDTTRHDTTVVNDTTVVIDTTIVDTTHVDPGDTVAINTVRLLERYVSVQPNPATERVQVLSSFGVSRVEVYSAAGLKAMDLKAEGFKATLDVSHMPSGTYLLRIHTQQGVVTKKLAVR